MTDSVVPVVFMVTLGVRGLVATFLFILAATVRRTDIPVGKNLARVLFFGGLAVALGMVADAEIAFRGTNHFRLLSLLFWGPMIWALYRLWQGVRDA